MEPSAFVLRLFSIRAFGFKKSEMSKNPELGLENVVHFS